MSTAPAQGLEFADSSDPPALASGVLTHGGRCYATHDTNGAHGRAVSGAERARPTWRTLRQAAPISRTRPGVARVISSFSISDSGCSAFGDRPRGGTDRRQA